MAILYFGGGLRCNMLEIVSDFTPWFWKVCMPHVFDYQMFNIQKPDQPRIEVLGISVLGYGILDSLILSCSQVGTRISQTFGSPWQSNSSTGGGSKAEGDDSLCIFYCNPVYPYKGSFCHGNMLRIQPPLATLFLLVAPQVVQWCFMMPKSRRGRCVSNFYRQRAWVMFCWLLCWENVG